MLADSLEPVSASKTEAISLPRRNATQKRRPSARRRRAVWRQARAPTSCCTIGAAATVEAKARPTPAQQGERQVCQRVSSKTPHPQGARVCEQRERVRPSNLPRIFETLLIVTQRAKTCTHQTKRKWRRFEGRWKHVRTGIQARTAVS